jgi:hypothetical protein
VSKALVVLVMAALVATGPVATASAAPSVLEKIPANAMGFVVIGDLNASFGKVDRFLADIGLAPMLQQQMPAGLLPAVQQQLGLGQGFDPNGGLAVVMLNPDDVGVDLVGMIEAEMDGEGIPEGQKVPFVVLVPGESIESVFAAYQPTKQGKYYQMTLPIGPMVGGEMGSHIALSPAADALEALAKSGTSYKAPAGHQKLIGRSDIAAHVNMDVAGPMLNKMFDLFEKKAEEMDNQDAPPNVRAQMTMMGRMMPQYRQMMGQVGDLTLAGRFVKTGLVVEQLADYKPDSELGKALAKSKAPSGSLLGRLPDMPYILAFGAGGTGSEMADAESVLDMYLTMLNAELAKNNAELDEASQKKIKELAIRFGDQVHQMQLVVGGAPQGYGVFGVSAVLRGPSAAKIRNLLAETVELSQSLIDNNLAKIEDDFQGLQVKHFKGSETVAGKTVDVVHIAHPELAKMSPSDRDEMIKVLGEDKIRLLIAQADDNTVVLSFGGGSANLAKSLEYADGKGPVPDSPGMSLAMEHMPSNRVSLMAFSAANLVDVIGKGMQTMDPNAPPLPIAINTRTPILIGTGIEGTSAHQAFYVPTGVVRDATGSVMMMMMGAMGGPGGPGGPPPGGGGDF